MEWRAGREGRMTENEEEKFTSWVSHPEKRKPSGVAPGDKI